MEQWIIGRTDGKQRINSAKSPRRGIGPGRPRSRDRSFLGGGGCWKLEPLGWDPLREILAEVDRSQSAVNIKATLRISSCTRTKQPAGQGKLLGPWNLLVRTRRRGLPLSAGKMRWASTVSRQSFAAKFGLRSVKLRGAGCSPLLSSLRVRRTSIRTRLFPKKSAAVRTGECESDTYFSKLWQLYFAGRLCGHLNPLDKDKTRWEKGERCECSHFAERSPWGPVEKEVEVSREVVFQVESATVPPVVPFSFPKVTRHARLRLKVVNIRVRTLRW